MTDKKKRTPEEARESHKQGNFVGAVIGGIIASLAMSGGVSFGVTKSSEADMTAQQESFQKYVDKNLIPHVEDQLDDLADEFEQGLDECEARAERAERDAYAALKAIELRGGTRVVAKAKEEAEAAVEPPRAALPTLPRKVKAALPRYDGMQQALD